MTNRRVIWALAAGNVGLLFVVGFLWAERSGGSERTMAPTSTFLKPTNRSIVAPVRAQAGQFHWSQLESTNFLTYVANLRAVGCPEQTLRDIIGAEVQALYAPVREAILDGENSSGGQLVSEREKLARDQAWLVDQLLGIDRPAAIAQARLDSGFDSARDDARWRSGLGPSASLAGRPVTDRREVAPLAGQARRASVVERATAAGIIGDGSAGVASPSQADDTAAQPVSRWRQARSQADQHLRVMIGDEAFLHIERERHLSTIRGQAPP